MSAINKILTNADQNLDFAAQLQARKNANAFGASQVADDYSSASKYTKGDLVIHDSQLYRALRNITSPGAWNDSNWELVTISNSIAPVFFSWNTVSNPQVLPEYDDIKSALENQKNVILKYNALNHTNEYYKFEVILGDGTLVFSELVLATQNEESHMYVRFIRIAKVSGETIRTFTEKEIVDKQYVDDATSGATSEVEALIASPYSNQSTYAVGDFVTKDGVLYRCTTAISQAETFTPAKWIECKVTDFLGTLDVTSGFTFAQISDLIAKGMLNRLIVKSGVKVAYIADYNASTITFAYLSPNVNAIAYKSITTSGWEQNWTTRAFLLEGTAAAGYDATATYTVGSLILRDGILYRCTTAIPQSEVWTPAHWTEVKLTTLFTGVGTAGLVPPPTAAGKILSSDGTWIDPFDPTDYITEVNLGGIVAEVYDPSKSYAKGSYVIHNKTLYRSKADSVTGTWDASKWDTTLAAKVFQGGAPGYVPEAPTTATPGLKFLNGAGNWVEIDISSALTPYITEQNLSNIVIPIYDDTHSYSAGDFCLYEKVLYKANKSTTGTFVVADWNPINLIEILNEKIASLGTVLSYEGDATVSNLNNTASYKVDGHVYSLSDAGILTLHDSSWDGTVKVGDEVVWKTNKWIYLGNITEIDLSTYITESNLADVVAPLYSNVGVYNVNDLVIRNKILYRCTTAIPSGESWNSGHWTVAKSTDIFQGSAPGLVPAATTADANKVLNGRGQWNAVLKINPNDYITEVHLGNIVATVYSATSQYAVNSYVLHNKQLYRCNTAIASGGEAWNSSHWTAVLATDIFDGSHPGLVPPATAGDATKALKGDGTWGDVSSVDVSYSSVNEELTLDFSIDDPSQNQ